MAFRDNALASREREIARLREELEKAKANDGNLEKRLADAELELEIERAKGGKIKRFFNEWATSREKKRIAKLEAKSRRSLSARPARRSRRSSFDRAFTLHKLFMACIFLGIISMIVMSVYHYTTDIQEGVVTSKAYHPPRTTCDDDGCTTYPEHWSVDIAYEGKTATWTVDETIYRRVNRGDWYCYVDLFHDSGNCQGPKD